MNHYDYVRRRPRGFTMLELVVAMVASTFLLAGLGSVMFIARQVAYSPTAASRRTKTADIVSQISDELRYATIIFQQTPQILEFVVADRNNDGTAEKIRYEWSGTAGDPLRKTINDGTPVDVLTSIYDFSMVLQQTSKTTTLTTTTDSAETVLAANANVVGSNLRDIDATNFSAQQVNPAYFSSVPANAISWNATKIDFVGRQNSSASETLTVQLRSSGDPIQPPSSADPNDGPTSSVLGQVNIPESSLYSGGSGGWNTVTFASPIRNLALNRIYEVVFMQASGSGQAMRLTYDDSAPSGVFESSDAGASWRYMTTRQIFGRIYGTYTTPGSSYNLTRNYVSSVRLALQSGNQSHARIDDSIPLRNSPELLASYWRTDFDRDPATTDANGDAVADWAVTGGGSFDTTKLANGVWTATGAIETRPLSDFNTTTTVEVRCRNTSVGGNGAVCLISADRQGGTYAPLRVCVQKQSDGTQTLTLSGKTSDAATKQLFSLAHLASGFVKFRLTILPQSDVVNLQINDEDEGTYTYPKYSPTSAADRYLTLYGDTSAAEFDYVEVRAGIN